MKRSIALNTAEMVKTSWPSPEHQTSRMRTIGWLVAGLTSCFALLTLILLFFKFGANTGQWMHILLATAITLMLTRLSIHTFVGPRLKPEPAPQTIRH